MKLFHRPTDEDIVNAHADDILQAVSKLVKESQDEESNLRLQIMTKAIEKEYLTIFFQSGTHGYTVYAPKDAAVQAKEISSTIMAAMHMNTEANEDKPYVPKKDEKQAGYA